jgi:hypothetical protein
VVWEGRGREASPYPDSAASAFAQSELAEENRYVFRKIPNTLIKTPHEAIHLSEICTRNPVLLTLVYTSLYQMPMHLGGFDRLALVVPELIGMGMSFSGCFRATQDVRGDVAGDLGEDMSGWLVIAIPPGVCAVKRSDKSAPYGGAEGVDGRHNEIDRNDEGEQAMLEKKADGDLDLLA